ncbi:MAG: anti-sigma factor [Burkholderiales bacterium]|nr:anti-sigma factor [Phycisphaerae bacterium]
MLLYASGAADPADRAAAEARLSSGDPNAQAAFAEALAVVNTLPLAIPQRLCPKRVRDQLMARVASSELSERNIATQGYGSPWRLWATSAVAAVLAIALTLTLIDRQKLSRRLAVTSNEMGDVRRVLSSPHVSLARLESNAKTPSYGRVLYCPVSDQYEVVVFNLVPPGPGKVYELWLITAEKVPMPAGTFTVDARGSGTINFSAPRGTTVASAAITDEPEGGTLSPTGSVHLQGQLQSQ